VANADESAGEQDAGREGLHGDFLFGVEGRDGVNFD
jgi:hypothetical protein